MRWTEFLTDSRPIRAIYGDGLPSLRNLALHELSRHRDGPHVTLSADLQEFPASPPRKWREQRFNTVNIKLTFESVTSVNIFGIDSDSQVSVEVSRENEQIHAVTGSYSTTVFDIWCDYLTLSSISAYQALPPVDDNVVRIDLVADVDEEPWIIVVRCLAGEVRPGTEFHRLIDSRGQVTPSALRVTRILRAGTEKRLQHIFREGTETSILKAHQMAALVLAGTAEKRPNVRDKLVG
jgi:hypothetical protein